MDTDRKVLPGDELEERGKIIRKKSLRRGAFETGIAMLIVGISTSFVPIPYFWLIATILTGIIIGYYGLQSHAPGHVGQPDTWDQIGPDEKCTGHGVSWIERFLGRKFSPVNIRVQIRKLSDITVLDKNNAEVIFKGVQTKYQLLRLRAFRLNTTAEDLAGEVDSKTEEALREKTSRTTYEKLKGMTSKGQKSIKTNIEVKLKEEQDLGAEIVAIEWTKVAPGKTVSEEDQEIIVREKRMNQVEDHIERLGELGVKGKEALKEWEILNKIVPEERKVEKRDVNFELGENVAGLAGSLLNLIPKKSKRKGVKNDK